VNRRASALVVPLALLTACGGGGGKSGSLPPTSNTPQTKKTGTATFSLKLPGKNTMSRVRRPYYQSQATQGVAIDWTSTNPYAPDYSAPISAACPALPTSGNPNLPPGVTSCTIDANGDTDYTFQLNIPAGTYTNFTVTTLDTAPTVGDFTGNELAQGQVAAPVVITAGTTNTIPSLTFYGIPATVSFVPAPSQSHVVMYGGSTFASNGKPTLAVIGNEPQTFYVQAEDADGFLISSTDSGAPTLTVCESSSDTTPHFTVATTSNANQFTLTAINASGTATINATATPGGTGLSAVTNAVPVIPVQELWTTQEAGTNPNGIFGYPIYSPGSVITAGPVDMYNDPIGNALCSQSGSSCNFDNAAIDRSTNTIYAVGINGSLDPVVAAFTLGSGSKGLVAPVGLTFTESTLSDTIHAIAIDAQQHGFLLDYASGTPQLEAYSTASSGWSPLTTSNDPNLSALTAQALAVAPTAPNVPSALAGSLWLGTSTGRFLVYPPYSGTWSATVEATAPTICITVMGFDSTGDLWMTDGTNVYIAKISGTPSAPTLTVLGQTTLASSGATGTSFGAATGQAMWFGEGGGEGTGYDLYTATCGSSSCTIAVTAQALPTNSGSWAAFVTP
jgi:hypothetical protein